jgi:hypothetical protein
VLNPSSYTLCNRALTTAITGEAQTGLDDFEGIQAARIKCQLWQWWHVGEGVGARQVSMAARAFRMLHALQGLPRASPRNSISAD